MANISYDFLEQPKDSGFKNSVGFFSLKNDGDDALVRILHNSVNDFDMLSCHTVEINGKYRKVNCLRNPRDDVRKCPLCEAGVGKLQQRVFVHLIQYAKDEHGNTVVLPKIWERSVSFARTIKSWIDEYGPLENRVFKIRRRGAAGTKETTYDGFPQDKEIYKESSYPIDKSGFENYSVLGSLVLDKSYDECVTFIKTGSFPNKKKSADDLSVADWGASPTFEHAVPRQQNPSVPSTSNTPQFSPVESTVTQATPVNSNPGPMPWETQQGFQPPRRY